MSDTAPAESPVVGDGKISLVIEEPPMADPIDLPPNIAAQLQMESISMVQANNRDFAQLQLESARNMQANNRNGRDAATAAMSVLQAAMARNFDELGTVESRATSGVLATPIAPPATGATGA